MKEKIKQKIIAIWKAIFKHPEDIEESLKKWFDENKRFSFLTALIVGIITHITFLTDMIMSQDGLWNSICYSEPGLWEASLGRWGLFIADKIVNNIAIPTVTGVVGVLFIVLSTVLIVDLLKLKNKITIFLVSAAMVVSPALTGTLLYVYTSVAYCLSMFLSVLTVHLIFKEKHKILNFILAIAIFVFSLGIYQSYIGVVIGLTVIRLIRDLYDKDVKFRFFFIHGIMLVVVVIVGGLLYSNITEKILTKLGVEESAYKGMNNISITNTIDSLETSIPKIYEDFSNFYFSDEIIKNTNYSRQEFYKVLFISIIICELILLISSKAWKNPFRILFIIAMNVILPVALNAVLLLTTDTTTYILTSAQLMLVIPFAAMICELSGKTCTFIFKWTAIVSMFLIVFTYYLADNTSYITLKLKYNQTYANAIRIIDRVEMTKGYSIDKPIMIAGVITDGDFGTASDIYEYTLGSIFEYPVFHATYSGMEGNWIKYMNVFLGYKIKYCNPVDFRNIATSEEFAEMEIFPGPTSVKLINGVMVVKLMENPPLP